MYYKTVRYRHGSGHFFCSLLELYRLEVSLVPNKATRLSQNRHGVFSHIHCLGLDLCGYQICAGEHATIFDGGDKV